MQNKKRIEEIADLIKKFPKNETKEFSSYVVFDFGVSSPSEYEIVAYKHIDRFHLAKFRNGKISYNQKGFVNCIQQLHGLINILYPNEVK